MAIPLLFVEVRLAPLARTRVTLKDLSPFFDDENNSSTTTRLLMTFVGVITVRIVRSPSSMLSLLPPLILLMFVCCCPCFFNAIWTSLRCRLLVTNVALIYLDTIPCRPVDRTLPVRLPCLTPSAPARPLARLQCSAVGGREGAGKSKDAWSSVRPSAQTDR